MRRKIIPYNPALKQLARVLRNNSTLAEVVLWKELKGKKMRGYDFHRQKPIDNYIVDFFCSDLSLAIEVDGIRHDTKTEYDKEREKRLQSLGVKLLRFNDLEVKGNLRGVVMAIEDWIDANAPTRLSPPEQGNSQWLVNRIVQ